MQNIIVIWFSQKKYACSHWLIHLTKMNETIFAKTAKLKYQNL